MVLTRSQASSYCRSSDLPRRLHPLHFDLTLRGAAEDRHACGSDNFRHCWRQEESVIDLQGFVGLTRSHLAMASTVADRSKAISINTFAGSVGTLLAPGFLGPAAQDLQFANWVSPPLDIPESSYSETACASTLTQPRLMWLSSRTSLASS